LLFSLWQLSIGLSTTYICSPGMFSSPKHQQNPYQVQTSTTYRLLGLLTQTWHEGMQQFNCQCRPQKNTSRGGTREIKENVFHRRDGI
jgi:hypothetical protein